MFRKLTVTLALALCAATAFAIPKPSEVKAAFAAGNYVKAESLLKEVMQERPTAAVHYQLGQVYAAEGKHSLALNEMRQAQVLDPTLKFASSAQAFTKALGTEQTLVSPPPVIVAQAPPVSTVTNSEYGKIYANPREVAQPLPVQHESSGGGLMIVLVLLALGVVGVVAFVFMGKKAASKALDEKAAANKERMSTLLDFSKKLEDSTLIAKTASYDDATKTQVLNRISALQSQVRNAMADIKDGKEVTASRVATIESSVNRVVDEAQNGIKVDAVAYAPVVDETREYVSRAETNMASTNTYGTSAPAPQSTQTTFHHYHPAAPAPVVVNNSNDGLMTGVILGSMMSNHHEDRVVERTVYVERPPVIDTPRYERDTYEAPAPAPAPAVLDTNDDDRNDSYTSSSDNSSIDSSPASDDTY